MFFADLLAALAFGLFIVWVVSIVFGTRGPWGSFLWFFVVVSLFAWAGGAWITPFGPHWGGVGWFPIILMGFLAVLLLTAASPRTSRKFEKGKEQVKAENETETAIGLFFWALVIILFIFGGSHYYWHPLIG